MADIAVAFGWTPRDMDPMPPGELTSWWLKARARMPGDGEESGTG